MIKWMTIGSLICLVQVAHGQISNKKCRWINQFDQSVFLDSLSIDPSTIESSAPIDFEYYINTGNIYLTKPLESDSIKICYRVFPFNLVRTYASHTRDEYDSTIATKPIEIPNNYLQPQSE